MKSQGILFLHEGGYPVDRINLHLARDGSSVECMFTWYADGRGLDPHVQLHSFVEFGLEIISTTILSLLLFQEGSCQLLAKDCELSTGKLPRRLAQEQCGYVN